MPKSPYRNIEHESRIRSHNVILKVSLQVSDVLTPRISDNDWARLEAIVKNETETLLIYLSNTVRKVSIKEFADLAEGVELIGIKAGTFEKPKKGAH